MNRNRTLWWLLPIFAFCPLGGCAKSEQAAEATTAAPTGTPVTPVSNAQGATVADPTKAVSESAAEKAPAGAAPKQPTNAKEATAEVAKVAFAPPFPKRQDMFRRPNVAANRIAKAERQAGGVELKGFVNAEKLKAVLIIEGQVAMVAQGDQRGDLEVIEVKPPQVILQRGRNRWTTSLFEGPSSPSEEKARPVAGPAASIVPATPPPTVEPVASVAPAPSPAPNSASTPSLPVETNDSHPKGDGSHAAEAAIGDEAPAKDVATAGPATKTAAPTAGSAKLPLAPKEAKNAPPTTGKSPSGIFN